MGSLSNSNSSDLTLRDNDVRQSSNLEYSSVADNTSYLLGISWGAVLAGTVVAAALMLALIILGVGLGMSSISVWSGQGISAGMLGLTTIVWLAFTQIIAYGMGGYLAGRLRVKWVSTHNDEVYFRDTAHGFLTWALSSLLCATLLASVIGSIVGGATKAGTTMTGGVVASATVMGANNNTATTNTDSNSMGMSNYNPLNYTISTLFRRDAVSTETNVTNSADETFAEGDSNSSASQNISQFDTANTGTDKQVAEIAAIFVNSMSDESLSSKDIKYIGQLVSVQTGLPQTEAEDRVAKSFTELQEKSRLAIETAKVTAEKARKTAAYTALWGFVFLLIGAFSASLAATWGGKSRDN